MNKFVTESPNGLTVSIAHFTSMGEAYEIETQDARGNGWSMWFDTPADILFLADVLNDYITERRLRERIEPQK